MPSSAATFAAINGSCAITLISNACARRATSCPMRPSPARPSTLPRTSSPRNDFLSHLPCFIDASAAGSLRASDNSCAIASSATLMLFAPGAFMTTMPRALAASTLTLSTPVPARAIARSFLPAAMMSGVTFVALRTTSASASAKSLDSSSGDRPDFESTSQPSARSSSRAVFGRSSATTIRMDGLEDDSDVELRELRERI